ncbi:MAG: helix-hairpin-helix domain-containing protein [Lactobacillales bacterium]|nr:helix-hairpin-helix domain-containing protein [Lactobacillales bacterium]
MDFEEFFTSHKKNVIGVGVGLILSLTLFLLFLLFHESPKIQKEEVDFLQSSTISSHKKSEKVVKTSHSSSLEIYVDVKGAVKHPGMYHLSEGKRVDDAIKLAGGTTDLADVSQVNYALLLTDQMIVYVPQIGEETQKGVLDSGKNNGMARDGKICSKEEKQVNLNTATLEELKGLTGIGEKKAQKIIDYREEKGKFSKVDDLQNVDGFGVKTIEKLRKNLTV